MPMPYDREKYNKAIQDCYPELAKARIANTEGKVGAIENHFSEVIKILQPFVQPIGLQPHNKA